MFIEVIAPSLKHAAIIVENTDTGTKYWREVHGTFDYMREKLAIKFAANAKLIETKVVLWHREN
jgi:hypothetical protein